MNWPLVIVFALTYLAVSIGHLSRECFAMVTVQPAQDPVQRRRRVLLSHARRPGHSLFLFLRNRPVH